MRSCAGDSTPSAIVVRAVAWHASTTALTMEASAGSSQTVAMNDLSIFTDSIGSCLK